MKLAEALQERADLNRRIEQLRDRLENNALVQEGETPAEDPAELLADLDRCVDSLEELIGRINLTNSRTRVGEYTLTELGRSLKPVLDAMQAWGEAYRAKSGG